MENKLVQYLRLSTLVLITFAIVSSCKKFVEIPAPTQSLVTSTVFDKASTATAAQLAVYAQMQSTYNYTTRFNTNTALAADEFKTNSSTLYLVNLYKNSLTEVNDSGNLTIWSQGYNLIYQCNAIIEGLTNPSNISPSVKRQLIGESKFLRAFIYFNLIGTYGDAPLILSTNYLVNIKTPRTSKGVVLQQIISDLKDAQTLLNDKYVDATDTIATNVRIRPNKWAATALLARAYLYTGSNWAEAEAQASSIIGNTVNYSLPNDLNSVFLTTSNEAIWQLQSNSNNNYTPDGVSYILTGDVTSGTNSNIPLITSQLLAAFETGDKRRANWINSITVPSGTYYFANKYKAGSNATTVTEYTTLLRLAEQFLIRAEARAKQNKIPEAISDLNIIRVRAGLTNLPTTLTQDQTLDAVNQERRVELFTEGHRWLDLKRTGTIDAVMTIVTPQKGGVWASYKQLFPVPIKDIQNSAGVIVQNIGY